MILDAQGYDEFQKHLHEEGVRFTDLPYNSPTPPPDAALPAEKTLKRLHRDSYGEYVASDSARKQPMALVETYWRRWNMQPYDASELLLAEQVNVTTPLIRSRVYQAHGSLYASLALTPFYGVKTDNDNDATLATHVELAFDEAITQADHDNAFDQALRGSLVATLGILKAGIVADEEGAPRLDVESVDLRDLFLSPHNVRDLQQCSMIAQRYYEPLGWVRDQAITGLFDPKVVKKVYPSTARDATDANATERDLHALPQAEGTYMESQMVELLEVYLKTRPAEGEVTEMWRLIVAREGWQVLRAERWEDGFPFWPIRHERGANTIFAPSFPSVLKDLQYGKDMLFSLAFEQNRMSVAPFVEYDPLSPAAGWLAQRTAEAKGSAVRILPGDLVPSRQGQSLKFTYHPPANMALSQAMNEIEAMAGSATIMSLPMQTYRSATEHRFAQGAMTAKEGQMMKVLRGDLTRWAEYLKRMWVKYVVGDAPDGRRMVQHGNQGYYCDETALLAMRLEPRGMTTQADQQQVAAASGEALQLTLTLAAQKPMLMQTGGWPQVYEAARIRLESMGFKEVQKVLGPPPTTDPNLVNFGPVDPAQQMQASMALMQAQAGQNPMQQMMMQGQPQPDQGVRGADGAPTVLPGGNPLMPGAPGSTPGVN